MTVTLVESSSFDAAPGPEGTDLRLAANVRALLQAYANRDRFLADRTTPLADIAALKAIANPANGVVRFVKSIGFFVFDVAAGSPEDLPFVVAPTISSGGRWLHQLYAVQMAAGGVPRLNASQQVLVPGSGFPTFAAARTRSVIAPIMPVGTSAVSGTPAPIPVGGELSNSFVVDQRFNYTFSVSGAAFAFNGVNTANANRYGALTDLTKYMHDGATLSSAVLRAIGPAAQVNLPTTMPSFGVFAFGGHSVVNAELLTTGNGFVFDSSANVTAFKLGHDITFTPNQAHTIDKTKYQYMALVFDQGGTNAVLGTKYYGIKLNFSGIADMRFP